MIGPLGLRGEGLILAFCCTWDEGAATFRELDSASAGFFGNEDKLYPHLALLAPSNYALTNENISVRDKLQGYSDQPLL